MAAQPQVREQFATETAKSKKITVLSCTLANRERDWAENGGFAVHQPSAAASMSGSEEELEWAELG